MQFRIEGMTCGGCARSVAAAINSFDAKALVSADPATRVVRVETAAAPAKIFRVLADAGYPATAA